MAVETELKLSLPASALPKLRQHRLLAGVRPQRQRLENTYYDTDDLALKRARVAVRHRRTAWGWLLTVKSAEPAAGGLAQRSEWEAVSQPDAFDFSHVENKSLRNTLEALTPSLLPAFTTDFLRTTWLLEPARGVSIEVALDRGSIRCSERQEAICELELELLSGPVSALFDLALGLQQDLPLHPAVMSKAERGYRVFQDLPLKPARGRKSGIDASLSPQAAFVGVALECIEQLQRNEAGARAGDDPEFVHQARVAIRRLRSALRLWAPILPADFLQRFAAPWQLLAQTMGEVRNLDVLLTKTLPPLADRFAGNPVLKRLTRLAEQHRQIAHRSVRSALEDPGFSQLLLGFTAALHALPPELLPESLASFSRRRLQRFARDVARRAEVCGDDPAAHHQLRIAFKRLRYALEFMAPLYADKPMRRYLGAAAEMQAVLGVMNDISVAETLVAELRQQRTDDLVHGWLGGQAALLQDLLPAALAGFMSARQPWR